ncbi:MAG: response regulator transcription factor [Chloroflexi bacterium]|nr:response regulator transcription factor [Chloroflexota bacterium]MCI0803388.1 response regulator transcription factor [Chloroflexota bacterium]MCI0836273.1 response regulator transcription factor [Chloroflexota bacterium]MCI0874457.1 response regulator transcription factor [Chloroflexota bacterium]
MSEKVVRVLIVDDHDIVRAGIRMLLDAQPDMAVIGEASDGKEAIEMAGSMKPDVVLMDISMPGTTGIEATRAIKKANSRIEIVGLTMHAEDRYFFQLLQAGASGYVVKGAAPRELLEAVRAASRGEAYIHPSLQRKLIGDYVSRTEGSDQASMLADLTGRELEVLRLIVDGLTSREIAESLVISPNTVERHRQNIMSKLGLHNRAELVRYAISKGLVEVE